MKQYVEKKQWWPWLVLILLILTSMVVLLHNASWYRTPLGQVTQVKVLQTNRLTDQYNNDVKETTQSLSVKLLNTNQAGKTITVKNTSDAAMAIEQPFKVGNQIFLNRADHQTWTVQTMKRDTVWVPIMIAVLGILIISMGHAGRLTVIPLAVNVVLFIGTVSLDLHTTNGNILGLFMLFSVLASAITLGLVMGFRQRQTWVVFATVLTATALAMIIASIVFKMTNNHGLHFELMSFITQLPQPLFMAMTLVGVLGAVMDEATDMIATLFSLERERPNITIREIIQSGRHVGQEIFGALSNTLFLIFIAEQIPMAVLYLRNGNDWGFTYMMNMSLGLVQTLISAIGIVLTVPAGIMWVLLVRRFTRIKTEVPR